MFFLLKLINVVPAENRKKKKKIRKHKCNYCNCISMY